MFVGNGGRPEWMCIVDLCTAVSRTPMLQTQGWQSLSLVRLRDMAKPFSGPIQVFTNDWPVSAKTVSHSFLGDGWSLIPSKDLLPRLANLPPYSAAHNKPSSPVQMYEIKVLSFQVAAAGASPSKCTCLTSVCLSFLHSLITPLRSIPEALQSKAHVDSWELKKTTTSVIEIEMHLSIEGFC